MIQARNYTGPEYTWGRRSGGSEARLCLVRTCAALMSFEIERTALCRNTIG